MNTRSASQLVAGLAAGTAAALALAGVSAAAPRLAQSPFAQTRAPITLTVRPARAAAVHRTSPRPRVVHLFARILTDAMDHKSGPELDPGSITLPAHATVVMTIRSYDDGPAPAPGFTTVRGTVGGVIRVNGKAVRSVAANRVAHTFTVLGLGLNVPIPAAPTGKYVTVQFTFHTGAAGVYTWQCYAQCGNGPTGWGYPMNTEDMMRGVVRIG